MKTLINGMMKIKPSTICFHRVQNVPLQPRTVAGAFEPTLEKVSKTFKLRVKTTTSFDYETQSPYNLQLRLSDGLLHATGKVTVDLIDANEQPSLSINDAIFNITERDTISKFGNKFSCESMGRANYYIWDGTECRVKAKLHR